MLKVYMIWLPWLLIFMRIQEMFKVTTDAIEMLVLSFYSSFAISLYRFWTCLIISITDVSHINMLSYQTPGISNQALVFMRDVKMFA